MLSIVAPTRLIGVTQHWGDANTTAYMFKIFVQGLEPADVVDVDLSAVVDEQPFLLTVLPLSPGIDKFRERHRCHTLGVAMWRTTWNEVVQGDQHIPRISDEGKTEQFAVDVGWQIPFDGGER